MFHNLCQALFIASRSCWVRTLTLVQLERLANLLLELAILMQVLCWALGSCCSRSIDALVWFLTVYYAVYLIFLCYLMLFVHTCSTMDILAYINTILVNAPPPPPPLPKKRGLAIILCCLAFIHVLALATFSILG
jgi:hypothetical protein